VKQYLVKANLVGASFEREQRQQPHCAAEEENNTRLREIKNEFALVMGVVHV